MLASFLKMVDVQTRRNVGILWAKVANKNPDDDYIALDTSPVLREYTWAKVLQQAYLSAVSKAYDEVRNTLSQLERSYGKREYLRTVTTPLNLSELGGMLSNVRESISDIVQTVRGIQLRERMLEAFQPLKTYIKGEVERLYREGYDSTLNRLSNGHMGDTAVNWQKIESVPVEETTANVYCPTGEGGGIDPTCKAGESGGTAVLDNPDQPGSTSIDKPKGGKVQRTNTLDQVSQLVFGKGLEGRSRHSSARQLTDDDIRAIGFSPEGTTVVAHGARGGEIHVNTESDEKDERGSPQLMASRTIRKPWFGPLTCYNGTVKVWGSFKGKGLELFDKQVKTLQGLGVKRILASASGDAQAAKTDPKTGLGYYVWPRMGYSGIMKSSQIAKLPEEIRKALKGKRDIRDLFDIPGGAEAWKEHGSTIKVRFDLSPNSRNMRALEAYKEEREKRPATNTEQIAEEVVLTMNALTEQQRDELYNLLYRLDELSFTEGVDSEEYDEVEKQLEAKRREYDALDVISED